MNQKDYEEIAKLIRFYVNMSKRTGSKSGVCKGFILDLADYFEKNPFNNKSWKNKFNRKQFLKQCGVEVGK